MGDTKATAAMGTIAEGQEHSELSLVPLEERGLRGLELAEKMFTPAQREQVAALLQVPAESPALMPYLALCIAEGFSPWANHVWLIPKKVKIPAQDGEEERTEIKHLPAVGRDGLLHKARQTKRTPGGYRGMSFGVVCERDTFEVEWTGDDMHDPKVLHRFASKPTIFKDGEAPGRYRGKIIGAWAKLRLDGEPPVFYFAPLHEHGRLKATWAWNQERRKRQPLYHVPKEAGGGVTFDEMMKIGDALVQLKPVQQWEGAWDYTSTMALKSAQSYVCRIGLGVTGFVPVDELRDVEAWQQDTGSAAAVEFGETQKFAEFDFDMIENDDLRERLRVAVSVANDLEPFSWGPAKCEMVLSRRSVEELAAIAGQIEDENVLRRERAQEPVEAAGEPEEVTGQVVEEEGASEDAQRLAGLRSRERDLRSRAVGMDPGSDEAAALSAELDQVQAEIRAAEDPGQGSLGV